MGTAFYHYRKVPFACSYAPGKLKLHFTALPSILGLMFGLMALAAVEKGILRNPPSGLVFLAFAAAAGSALRTGNGRFYRTHSLIYDYAPEAAIVVLGEEG